MTMTKNEAVLAFLEDRFPDAKCALHFADPFQCLIAVSLSAQTNDKSVNQVTPALFLAYPDPFALAKADPKEVEPYIESLGLYHNKAKNIVNLANALVNQFDNAVPLKKEELLTLPGVGIKTTNVVLAECAGVPAIAVDTHVNRVAVRLGYATKKDEPVDVEKKLEKQFDSKDYIKLHHQIIAFGRAICHSQKPECEKCGLKEYCSYFKKCALTTAK
jgi:endonuclease-3